MSDSRVVEFMKIDVEILSARLHDIYQLEAHRRGVVDHPDTYEDLDDSVKEWDRVLARWILRNWVPSFDPGQGLPAADEVV